MHANVTKGLNFSLEWSVGFSVGRFDKGGNNFPRVVCITKVVVVVVVVLVN
jgi:hypothetical protein